VLKSLVQGIAFLLVIPAVVCCGFGRIRMLFTMFGQSYSLVPGLPGDYLRIAFYRWTLEQCSLESRVSFGSFFAHPEARLGERVAPGREGAFAQRMRRSETSPSRSLRKKADFAQGAVLWSNQAYPRRASEFSAVFEW